MRKNAVIISGGALQHSFVCRMLERIENPYIIAVDKGLSFCYRFGIIPDQIVGDFDSLAEEVLTYYKEKTAVPIRAFNPVKDASDTEIGVRFAMEKGCEAIYLFGATGTRLDHVLANIQVLTIPLREGIHAEILDSHNRIRLVQKEITLRKEEMFGPYFSVFPLGGIVEHFSITGAKYPLSDHTLCPYDSLCVSNQAKEDSVHIQFPEGTIILMETSDESKEEL